MFAKESFQSKSPTKRLHGWFYEVSFSMGNLTSLQLEGTCAINPSPLRFVSVKNMQKLSGNKGKRRSHHFS